MLFLTLKPMFRKVVALSLLLLGAALPAQAAFPTGDVATVVSWLPDDMETISYASGPLTIPIVKDAKAQRKKAEAEGPTVVPPQPNISSQFHTSNVWFRVAEKRLQGRTVTLSLEGRKRFRSPKDIGMERYEGCGILRLQPDANITQQQLSEQLHARSKKKLTVLDVPVALISGGETKNNRETWEVYLAAPTADTVLIATDVNALQYVLWRMKTNSSPPVSMALLGPRWQGWDFVDTNSRFWMVRHDVSHTAAGKEPNDIVGFEDVANGCLIITGIMSDRTEFLDAVGGIRTETNLRLTTKEIQVGIYEIRCWLNGDSGELGTLAFYLTKIFGPTIVVAPF
jgi:hypothetical protein